MKYTTTSILAFMGNIMTASCSIIGILLLFFTTSCSQVPFENPGHRAQVLKLRLVDCDRLVVSEVFTAPDETPVPPYTCTNQQAIAELVTNLEFDDRNSGFHCMCGGDSLVTFYKGTNVLATVSHHHGKSLRWDGWQGDSLFTAHTKEYWRMWFLKNGEPRYEEMHQEEVSNQNEDDRINALFLSSFPKGTDLIFANAGKATQFGMVKPGKAYPKKLEALFPNREGLAIALTKGLGHLSAEGDGCGSWSSSSTREQLVLQLAETLSEEELRETATSSDPIVRLGTARLFFFEGAYRDFPTREQAEFAARLCRDTLMLDRCGNYNMAIRAMKHYPSPEAAQLLKEIAGGDLSVVPEKQSWKRDPSPRYAACVILAYHEDPATPVLIEILENQSGLDEFDTAALKVSRALLGETNVLDASVFEPDSYTIGYGALDALEKQGDKDAIELVIMAGTKHSWGAVRDKAVVTAARMTGQNWADDRQGEKSAQAWWEAARDSYGE